jgi:hypothetical protein
MAIAVQFRDGRAVEEKMDRILHSGAKVVLFIVLAIVVTGIWACLWLPPY